MSYEHFHWIYENYNIYFNKTLNTTYYLYIYYISIGIGTGTVYDTTKQ